MSEPLDDIDHQHLRAQVRLSARSGLVAAVAALVASYLISGDTVLGSGSLATAFAIFTFVIDVGFVAIWVAERRLPDRWVPFLYGATSWVMLQAVIGISNQFTALVLIGPVMMGILPVAIALFGRWRPIHQIIWCVTGLVPMAFSIAIPIGQTLWPQATRLSTLEAFALGSALSILGIRVLDDARTLFVKQQALTAEAHAAEHVATDALRRSERRYREIVELSKEGIWVADIDGNTTLANDRAAEILGYQPGDLAGRNLRDVLDPAVASRIRAYLGTGSPDAPLEDVPARRADGTQVWLSASATRLLDDGGTPFGTIAMFSDVSHRHQVEEDLRESNEALDRLAYLDGLTGLQNRRALDGALVERATSRRQIGVLMIDIDRFKSYNDANGHQGGDEALRSVGQALMSALRPDDKVYRYGGEEFLILVDRASSEQALVIAERARAAVAALRLPLDPAVPERVLTVSIGVASGRPFETSMRSMIAAADAALYRAKAEGRDRSICAAPSDVKPAA